MTKDDRIYFNGIDGTTGQYVQPPLRLDELAALAKGQEAQPELTGWLGYIWNRLTQKTFGLPLDVVPEDVTSAGWAVVFHHDEDAKVKAALEPLVAHRRKQIGNESIVKVLEYFQGDGRAQWLARQGAASGAVVPSKVPYYVLLVGSPSRIPFEFAHLLDVEYAVGCLDFDSAADYETYVLDLIAYETSGAVAAGKQAVFFGTRHDFDAATQMSADILVEPLAEGEAGAAPKVGVAQRWGFGQRKILGDKATKAALLEALAPPAGTRPPSFLFTASHGMAWPKGHAQQRAAQGALLCQDWPGFGAVAPAHYLAASDVPDEAKVRGLISFHFACYGIGTPSNDRYAHKPGQPPPAIADAPFLAALPKRLLTHPGGSALACIGHVERAWGYSIATPKAGPQLLPFQNAIGRILLGHPVGHALKDFNEKYASLSASLAALLEQVSFGAKIPDDELARQWTERNDAEGYLVVGDPAVSLRVKDLKA